MLTSLMYYSDWTKCFIREWFVAQSMQTKMPRYTTKCEVFFFLQFALMQWLATSDTFDELENAENMKLGYIELQNNQRPYIA